MGKVQRSAVLKASCSLNSTCTEALEVLTNTLPTNLPLKKRHAQDMVRINAKYDNPHKNFKDFLFKTEKLGTLKLELKHQELETSKVCSNDNPRLTFQREGQIDLLGMYKGKHIERSILIELLNGDVSYLAQIL